MRVLEKKKTVCHDFFNQKTTGYRIISNFIFIYRSETAGMNVGLKSTMEYVNKSKNVGWREILGNDRNVEEILLKTREKKLGTSSYDRMNRVLATRLGT